MAAPLRRVSRRAESFIFSKKAAVICRNIHTTVWWDIDRCKIPKGCDPSSIAGNITAALAKLNHSAPVVFHAYGNAYRIPLNVQQALSESGVTLVHIPAGDGDKYGRGRSTHISHDISRWRDENPEPANLLIISGDRRHMPLYHYWIDKGYNLLFASPRKVGDEMKSAATAFWQWTSLRAGGPPAWTSQ